MRVILYGLAIASVALLFLSVFQLNKSYKGFTEISMVISDLKGFDDVGPNREGFKALRDTFASKVNSYQKTERESNTWWLIASFVVTGLAAAATLVSTVSAAKNKETVPVNTIKVIAVITFATTLVNWGTTQLADAKGKAVVAIQTIKDLRSSFYADYQQETTEDKKKAIIEKYEDKLGDLC